MDALLKKYAERIERVYYPGDGDIYYSTKELRNMEAERLLLQFLLEYVELRENKKGG